MMKDSNLKNISQIKRDKSDESIIPGLRLYSDNKTIHIKPFSVSKNYIPLNTERTHNHSKSPSNFKNRTKSPSMSNYHTDINHQCLSHMKLCQISNIPTEKNYYISEKNLKLIEKGIAEKDTDIASLKNLLSLAQEDIKSFNDKHSKVLSIIEELKNEKIHLVEQLENVLDEKSKLNKSYDFYIGHFERVLKVFKKLEKGIKHVFKLTSSYNDYLSMNRDQEDSNNQGNTITFEKDSKFIINLNEILKFSEDVDFRHFNFLTDSNLKNKYFIEKSLLNSEIMNLNNSSEAISLSSYKEDSINFSQNELKNIKRTYVQELEEKLILMEKENNSLKSQFYDLDSFLKKVSHLYESKTINLSETAKDTIEMKKRILGLNRIISLNDKEINNMKIYIHNLTMELNTKELDYERGYQAKMQELQDKLNALETKEKSFKEEISNLKAKLERTELEIKFITDNNDRMNEDLLLKYNTENSERLNLIQSNSLKENEIKKLNFENSFILAENSTLKEQFDTVMNRYNNLMNEFNDYKLKSVKEEEFKKYIQENKIIDVEFEILKGKYQKIIDELGNKDKLIEELKSTILNLQRDNSVNKNFKNNDNKESLYSLKSLFKKEIGQTEDPLNSSDLNIENRKKKKMLNEYQLGMKNGENKNISVYVDLLYHLTNQAKLLEKCIND